MEEGVTFDTTNHKQYYSPDPLEGVSLFLSVACVSIMAVLLGRKTAATKLSSLNYPRILVVILYVISWLFSLMAAMLVQTNNNNQVSCTISNFVCIFLYAGSKIVIYLFLVERVHAVTSVGVTRWKSPLFKFNIAVLLPISVIFALTLKYRVSIIDKDGMCRIGLEIQASIPLIVYDCILNIWLTTLFVRALVSSTSHLHGPTKTRLRNVARRTLIASILSLIFSSSNIASIVAFNGHERGVLCLTLCTLDVTLNAATIHWVTSPRSESRSKTSAEANTSSDGPTSRTAFRAGKQASPLDSHISVLVESYVEEYRQPYIANKSVLDRNF